MKQKLSITLDEKTIKMIEEAIKEGLYRNKSHVVEFSLTKCLEKNEDDKKVFNKSD